MAAATPQSRSVVLFVRSLSPAESPATDHVDTVRELASRGRIADASISVWGREIGLSTTARRTDTGAGILDRVARFRSWARENDLTMEPFFETREVQSSVTGEEYTALSLPVGCLAEYEDGSLVHVAPYCNDRAVCTVGDRLGTLDKSDFTARPSPVSTKQSTTH